MIQKSHGCVNVQMQTPRVQSPDFQGFEPNGRLQLGQKRTMLIANDRKKPLPFADNENHT